MKDDPMAHRTTLLFETVVDIPTGLPLSNLLSCDGVVDTVRRIEEAMPSCLITYDIRKSKGPRPDSVGIHFAYYDDMAEKLVGARRSSPPKVTAHLMADELAEAIGHPVRGWCLSEGEPEPRGETIGPVGGGDAVPDLDLYTVRRSPLGEITVTRIGYFYYDSDNASHDVWGFFGVDTALPLGFDEDDWYDAVSNGSDRLMSFEEARKEWDSLYSDAVYLAVEEVNENTPDGLYVTNGCHM